MKQGVPLIIPVESQIREFDAKLLLACVAARRHHPVVFGRLKTINARIGSWPRSIYLAKDVAQAAIPVFTVLHRLGHVIVAWDEESLVHLPAETYFSKRMSPETISYVSHLFAWGQENADLWRSAPHYSGTPVHITGNPRFDLLRPEMRPYFQNEINRLRLVYGDYFLVNTNFSVVNSNRTLFQNKVGPGGVRVLSRRACGMTREFAEKLERYKLHIFQLFKDMIPRLALAFPNINLVIRPHPSEDPRCYHHIAAKHENVRVLIEGNVIPWLVAAKAIIHNGCTTAVEASLLGAQAISFCPTKGEAHEFGLSWRMPDLLSHTAEDFIALHDKLGKIMTGELDHFAGVERNMLIGDFITPAEGPLACEKIIDVLEKAPDNDLKKIRIVRLVGLMRAYVTRSSNQVAKLCKRKAHKAPEARRATYHDHTAKQLNERLDLFQSILGDRVELKVNKFCKYVYRITRS